MSSRKYVYVDSRMRNRNEPINDFNVILHNPIKNVSKVGVISFTKGNNSYNVHAGNNIIRWREVYALAEGVYGTINNIPYFQISIPQGYWGINTLLTEITTKMSETLGRRSGLETATSYTYSIDDDYKISIKGTASSAAISNRWWGFYDESTDIKSFNNSILHSILGLRREDVLADTSLIQQQIPNSYNPIYKQSITSATDADRTLQASFSYTENQSVLYLASSALSENSQQMVNKNNITSTMKTNILETINVLVNRWSFIHLNKASNDIIFHNLHNKTISHFDLKLLGEHYNLINEDAESDFKCVLVFETVEETATAVEMNKMYRDYNADAYKQAHRIINY